MLFLCLSLLLSLLCNFAHARPAQEKPNIIMLFVDDLGYGDVGFNGHPTTRTPNIDQLAFNGKILSSWYSGCPVCSGSRAALMTGRQYTRIGTPGVFGPTGNTGLPLNETTVADQAKKAGYATAIVGKWHLGNREMFLPGNRGFDEYLGIPYSDDMGGARATSCLHDEEIPSRHRDPDEQPWWEDYCEAGFCGEETLKIKFGDLDRDDSFSDPAGTYLPLVYQNHQGSRGALNTTVLEQPLDFTHLADKYNDFLTSYIDNHADDPFFLYVPFSHVHTTNPLQPEELR
jgi:arylsulfatase A